MYKPHYVLYGILWVLALEGTAAVVSTPQSWRPTWHTAVRLVVVLFVLLYLRMVDEQKDLDYDRIHNPDRPLVTGAVTATDLRIAMAVIAAGSVSASAALSFGSAVMIASVLAYGLGLWGIEAMSRPIRDNILLNLVVTYPVQLLVTAYVVVSAVQTGEAELRWQSFAIAAIFAGAFLQFEFARKTSKVVRPDEMYYSNFLGSGGAVAAGLVFAGVAVLVNLVVMPLDRVLVWIPVLLLAFPVWGAAKYLRTERVDYPLLPPVLFIVTLYSVLIAQALVL
ncbi:hypothetical protein [Rhodococcus sp. NPDC058521]|uniref:hypothetical protein n=1 Tax=Rhodococcus sp. NPDC058521 TaxID=3346536 RepID=UPI00364D4195